MIKTIYDSGYFWLIIVILVVFHWIILPILVVLLPFIIVICAGTWFYQWLVDKKDEK